jgi:hypothetical protein
LSFRSLTWRQRLGADLDGNGAREGGDADGGAGVAAAVAAANARLPAYAQLRRWAFAPEAFSFDAGTLTANGRPRREAIALRHAALIESLYEEAAAS